MGRAVGAEPAGLGQGAGIAPSVLTLRDRVAYMGVKFGPGSAGTHADAERVRVVRRADVALAAARDDLARGGLIVADQALHERALARAVLWHRFWGQRPGLARYATPR
jgi:hypothetical protein